MICQTCSQLFCRCFMPIHKRQPVGVEYHLLKDDKDERMAATVAERRLDRKEADRRYYQRTRDARKNS